MTAFKVKFNLTAETSQQELIQKIKQAGGDCIQISSGLCAKGAKASDAIKDLAGIEISGLTDDDKSQPDIAAFLSN